VKAVNIVYEFQKAGVNQYILHCVAGSNSGHWKSNPQAAIAFLFQHSDERLAVEDVFNGAYTGTIESVEFLKANKSPLEGYSGIVKLQIREEV
jgi:hypothetical protein